LNRNASIGFAYRDNLTIMPNRKNKYIQTSINNYTNNEKKQYFQPSQQKVYKEKKHTFYRKENYYKKPLINNEISENHQDRISILMAKESDTMNIKPQQRCNIENGYKCFSKKELQNYLEVGSWLNTVSKSSQSYYIRAIELFCNWIGKNPSELINERNQEVKSDNPIDRNNTRDMLIEFRKELEKMEYAPKSINVMDGAIRSFYSANLGKMGMINIRNYSNSKVSTNKDLVPTLEELKKMLDVVDIEEKFRIIFIAQTGMRVSDAVKLKYGDIKRELEQNNNPLAIRFLPTKDREIIGERITFLGSDGIEILKQYLQFRKERGDTIIDDSPLFASRIRKRGKHKAITQQKFNETIKKAGQRIGLVNGDSKYGRIRIHCLRKFFITQLTNHGVEDKIINFLTCHKISDVDSVYWNRRIDSLREIYNERQQYLNPINGDKKHYNLEEIKDIQQKIQDMDNRIPTANQLKNMIKEILEELKPNHNSIIVNNEDDIIKYSRQGYSCTSIGNNKWLMKN
jgi:integrase/recombinase XerD